MLCRHSIGVNHYVKGSRNDKINGDYGNETRDQPTEHLMYVNLPELVHILSKRIQPECHQAMIDLCYAIIEQLKELKTFEDKRYGYIAEKIINKVEYGEDE